MELISPRKKMAMGKIPARAPSGNPGKSSANLNRRSKRVMDSKRRSMVTSHTKATADVGMEYISMGKIPTEAELKMSV